MVPRCGGLVLYYQLVHRHSATGFHAIVSSQRMTVTPWPNYASVSDSAGI